MREGMHRIPPRGKIPSGTHSIAAAYEIKPKVVKMKNFPSAIRMDANVKKDRRMIGESTAKMLEFIKLKNIDPFQINEATIQPGPATSRAKLIVAPSKLRTREIKINEII